ncbi:hypothetical protein HF319_10800 [Xanthomonas sp. Kuri4-1]
MGTEKVLVLRTCAANMADYGGLIWPRTGEVICQYFLPEKKHENGLFGLLRGKGNKAYLSNHADAKWVVCEVAVTELILLDEGGVVKFPRAEVVYVGTKRGAEDFMLLHQASYEGDDAPLVNPMASSAPASLPGYELSGDSLGAGPDLARHLRIQDSWMPYPRH